MTALNSQTFIVGLLLFFSVSFNDLSSVKPQTGSGEGGLGGLAVLHSDRSRRMLVEGLPEEP